MDDLLKQDVSGQQVVLEMKDISKSFSGVTVLHNVNLTLMEGEIQGLVG